MAGIFDEKKMMQALHQYLPKGETITAAIHACASESSIRHVFSKCVLVDGILMPKEDGDTIEVQKTKYASYDMYIGITSRFLILAECEAYKHLYEINSVSDESAAEEVKAELSLEDIGTCYPFEAIQRCEMKKGWMGSVKCTITMKNGDYFKLMFPKRGGLGGAMPHHEEYREKIISCLNAQNQ